MTDANLAFPMAANLMTLFEVPKPIGPEICIIGIAIKSEIWLTGMPTG